MTPEPDQDREQLLHEISRLRSREAELLQTTQFLRRVTEASPNGLFVWDLTAHRPVYFNPAVAAITGYSAADFEGVGPDFHINLVHTDDRSALADALGRLLVEREGKYAEVTFRQRYADGQYRWLHTRITPFTRAADGQTVQVLGVFQDVTAAKQTEADRKRLEEQMQHAQKLESLGVLAGGIAHDFNNLLTGVLGNASLALMELPRESPVRNFIQQIESSAWRAADLTQQMLAYAGRGKFVIQPINLSRLIEGIAKLFQAVVSKKATLRFEFPLQLPDVAGDATQLRQVAMNLITNASDALGDDIGVIAIRTGVVTADKAYLSTTWLTDDLPEGRYVFLEVSDTGCGMGPATVERIFDPFFSTKFTGRGLGLAALLGIVRGHHGTVKVYSEPGQGTTFKVLFPCVEEPQPAVTGKSAEPSAWRGQGLVLVADDEKSVRGLAKTVLRRVGFDAVEAGNGRECLELFREHEGKVVAVLLDLTMPEMNGEETFRELRMLQPDVRVIMMSGYSEGEVATRFAGKGLASVLQKPFHPSELIQTLRRVLEQGGG